MNLTKNKIFCGIITFLFIVDILIAFDLNALYIRAILGFIFLITIPGLLIMLMLKIREVGFWEYLVYTIGLSVSFIMFAGLAVNWILPWLNITDKPLSLWPVLICFNVFLLIFMFVAYKRNRDLKPINVSLPKLNTLNTIMFIVPLSFPFLAVLGAFLLNNHGPNYLTMILLGSIAIYVLLIVILRDKLNSNIYPWALWLIGLSLLLSGWMRSWYVSGPDISLEYWVFELTKNHEQWSLSNFNNAYNAMLSLNIFPATLSLFTKINSQFIFKLIIPIILSLTPVIIYLISKKKLSKISSLLAGILFLALPGFINWYSNPIRQAIAFLFFGLLILTLLKKEGLTEKNSKILFVILGFSMVVSHYSTSYIGLFLFLIIYCIYLIYSIKNKNSIRALFPLVILILLFLFGFIWYAQVTSLTSGPIGFMKKSFSNLGNLFNEDTRQNAATDPFFGFFKKANQITLIEEYKNNTFNFDISNTAEGFSKESFLGYSLRYKTNEQLSPKFDFFNLFTFNYYIKQIISKVFQFFILIGLVSLFLDKKTKGLNKIIFISTGLVLIFFVLLPFFSIDYGIDRFIQQTFIILAPISIFGGEILFKRIKIKPIFLLTFLVILFFLIFSGFIPQLLGGDEAKMQLNNLGKDYEINYMYNSDFEGASWLNLNHKNRIVYSDANAHLKLNAYGGVFNSINTQKHLLPQTISKKSYIYLSQINKIEGRGFFSIKGLKLSYNFPTEFLNENKNKIYNNGGSEIFK